MLLYTHCVLKGKAKVDGGNLRPTAKVKTRVPWIPPGKASIRDASYKWEVTHLKSCLSIVRASSRQRLKVLLAPRVQRTVMRSHHRSPNLNFPSLRCDWLTSHQKKRVGFTDESASMRERLTAYWLKSALWRMRSVSTLFARPLSNQIHIQIWHFGLFFLNSIFIDAALFVKK